MNEELAGELRAINGVIKRELSNNRDAIVSLINIRDVWNEFYDKYFSPGNVNERLDKLEHGQKNNKQIITTSMELVKNLIEKVEALKK